jgi:hypothetical protein
VRFTSWHDGAGRRPLRQPDIETRVTDDDFAALNTSERDFALRWIAMTPPEQESFCRGLLAAIEVLQRLGQLEPPDAAAAPQPA